MDNLSPETMQLILVSVGAVCASVIIFVLLNPILSGEKQAAKRLQTVTENKAGRSARHAKDEEINSRRKQVADTLKDLEERQKAKEKISLRLKLLRAGFDATPQQFWIVSGIVGAVCAVGALAAMPTATPLLWLAAGFIGMLGLPQWFLKMAIKRRQKKFVNEFANAIDIVVRGVKSGLPLNECLNIIARESPSPIKEEFQEVVEQTRVGVPLMDSFERMMTRMPLAEVKFFGIVIGIQQQAGGNLSEALGNLSGVLRDRKRMAAKVAALSAEAKASAGVLASLPFGVMTMVYLTTPAYIAMLFNTTMGNFMLIVAAGWMLCGILVMRKMINFKY